MRVLFGFYLMLCGFVCLGQSEFNERLKKADQFYDTFRWHYAAETLDNLPNFHKAHRLYSEAFEIDSSSTYVRDRLLEIERTLVELKEDSVCSQLLSQDHEIPENMFECMVRLDSLLCSRDKDVMRNLVNRDEMVRYHHGLGMYLRNRWGLWQDSKLCKYFEKEGIRHPDDMSGIILDYYYDWLNGDKDSWKNWSEENEFSRFIREKERKRLSEIYAQKRIEELTCPGKEVLLNKIMSELDSEPMNLDSMMTIDELVKMLEFEIEKLEAKAKKGNVKTSE
ncbi:MAG: hypothetical protein GC178_09150 [Flavobacteriales bacterium]|nr:hypothetical protein [Flavobacteriales bacterium]